MKQPAPIKWRNNPNDYSFPRSSKEAFGYEFSEDDFETDTLQRVGDNGDMLVAIGCVVMALVLVIFL